MVDDASVLCESSSLELNFSYSSLNLSCAFFREELNTSPQPSTGGFLYFTQSIFFLLVLVLILFYLAGEKTW
jgi:hypothetical protein